MNFFKFLGLALSSAILTACGSSTSHTFKQQDLDSSIYQGYWAMHPVEGQHRVLKFQTNGAVKIYDYYCDTDGSYSLNETETVYLSTQKSNAFILLDNKNKPFARYEILRLTDKLLQAKQSFETERPLILNYTHLQGAKPLC